MKNLTFIFAIIFATSSYAQFDQGTMTFGAGFMFNSTASFEDALFEGDGRMVDFSYFVTDGVMVSLSLSGQNEVTETQTMWTFDDDGEYVLVEDDVIIQEAEVNWTVGARYYFLPDNGLFAGLSATKVEWQEQEFDSMGISTMSDEKGMDYRFDIGMSKELGFDGKLWFEPALTIMTNATMEGSLRYALMSTFRFAF